MKKILFLFVFLLTIFNNAFAVNFLWDGVMQHPTNLVPLDVYNTAAPDFHTNIVGQNNQKNTFTVLAIPLGTANPVAGNISTGDDGSAIVTSTPMNTVTDPFFEAIGTTPSVGDDITIDRALQVNGEVDIKYHNSIFKIQNGRVYNVSVSTTTNNGYNFIHLTGTNSYVGQPTVGGDISLTNTVNKNDIVLELGTYGTAMVDGDIHLGQGGDTIIMRFLSSISGDIYGNNPNGNTAANNYYLSAHSINSSIHLGVKEDYVDINGGWFDSITGNGNSTESADINIGNAARIYNTITLRGNTNTAINNSGDRLTITGGTIGFSKLNNENSIICEGLDTNIINISGTTTINGILQLGQGGDNVTVNGANVNFTGFGIMGSNVLGDATQNNTIHFINGSISHIRTGRNGDTIRIDGGTFTGAPNPTGFCLLGLDDNSNTYEINGGTFQAPIQLGGAGDNVTITDGDFQGGGTPANISTNVIGATGSSNISVYGGTLQNIYLCNLGDIIKIYGGEIQTLIPSTTATGKSTIEISGGELIQNLVLSPVGDNLTISGGTVPDIIGKEDQVANPNVANKNVINVSGGDITKIIASNSGDEITITGGVFSEAVSLSSQYYSGGGIEGGNRTTYTISGGQMNDISLSKAGDKITASGTAQIRDIYGDTDLTTVPTGFNEIIVQDSAQIRSITTGVGLDLVTIAGGIVTSPGILVGSIVNGDSIIGRDAGKNTFSLTGGVVSGRINLGKAADDITVSGGNHQYGQILGSQSVINPAPGIYIKDPDALAHTITLTNGTIQKITTSFNGDTVNISGGTIPGDGTNSIVGGYITGQTITGALANTFNISGGTIQDNILLGTKADTITVTQNATVENITGNADTGIGQTYIVGINGGDNSNVVVNDITTSGYGDTVTVYGGTIANVTISQQHATNYQNQINMTGGTVTNLITFQTAGTSVTLSGTANVAGIVATYDPSGIPLFNPHVYPNVRNTINLSDNAIIGAQGINLQREYFQTSININGGRILGPTIGGYGQNFTDHDDETITAFPEDIVTINGDFSTENIFYSLDRINVGNGTNTPTFTVNNNIGIDPADPTPALPNYKQIQGFTVNQNAKVVLNSNAVTPLSIKAGVFTNNGELMMQNGTTTITAEFFQGVNGTLRFEIEPTAAASGKLNVQEEAPASLNLRDGNIILNVRAGDVTNGRLMELLQCNDPMLNTGISLVEPDGSPANSAIFTFTPQFTGGDRLLSVLVAKKPYTDFVGSSVHEVATANLLNTLEYSGTLNADLENLLTTLLRESDPNQVTEFIRQITPDYREDLVHDSYYLTMSEVYQMIETRLSHLRLAKLYPTRNSILSLTQKKAHDTYSMHHKFGKTLPSVDVNTNTFKLISKNKLTRKNIFYAKSNSRIDPENFWVQFFGNSTKQKRYESLPAYTGSAVGFGLGVDANISRFLNIGTSFAYSITKIKSQSNVGNELNVTSSQFSLYGMYDPGNYFIEGILSVGFNDYESKRNISAAGISRTAYGEYDGKYYSGKVRSGYNFYHCGFEITPLLEAHHAHLNTDPFSETGAIGLNLQNVSYSNVSSLMIGAGVRISLHAIHDEELFVPHYLRHEDIFVPHIIIMLEHELDNKKADVSAKFEGSPISFRNELRDADRTKINLGLGFTLYNKSNLSLLASYNYVYRAHGHGHHAYLKFNYKF